MRVAVCMIVKDGVATIERAISSARPFVDEVCVYDTGSTDGTLELLERLQWEPGAPIKVQKGEWRDDYAWALNEAFAMSSMEWQMRLDDDEELIGGNCLSRLVQIPESITHICVRWTGHSQLWPVRLTRKGACKWVGKIHEALIPEDESAFIVAFPDALRIEHPNDYDTEDTGPGRHDAAVLAVVESDPDASPWLKHFYVAGVLSRAGDREGAEREYRRYLDVTAGIYEWGRLTVLLALAGLAAERGDAEGAVAILQERDQELDAWRTESAAGRLTGIAAAGPDFFPTVERWERPRDRNSLCGCGSGLKTKLCCAHRVFALPLFPKAESADVVV